MFTRRPTDDQLGLLAVDLGDAATPLDRELVSDRLRTFGGGEAAWEDGRRALFTLEPERLPAGESAADNVLAAALAVRELLLTPVAIACDVLPGSAGDAVRWLVPRRLMARVGEHPGALVVTKAIAECRAARDVPIERIPGTVEALSVVRPGARARIAPLGRWVVPLGQEDWERRSATGALLDRPWIEDGLLRPERVDDKLDASELLRAETPLVAVVGPAWTGKTHLVGALSEALARTGTPHHVTSLEHREGGHTHWPDQAFLRASGERVWLVDALDEGVARQVNLGNLQNAGAHDGLRTIVTTRSDERAFEVLSKLSVPRSTYVLLPLDREAVLRDVCEGDASRLDALLAMARHMRLEHPLSFAEWQELDRQVQHGGEPDRRTLLGALLGALLDRRCERLRRGRVRELPAGMSRAARWLAAAAAATGEQRFTFGAGSGLDVLRVVPDDSEMPRRRCATPSSSRGPEALTEKSGPSPPRTSARTSRQHSSARRGPSSGSARSGFEDC